jgi:hypothetical protein
MTRRAPALLLSVLLLAGSLSRADSAPLRVLYLGAGADSRQGLFDRWCEVIPARLGGPPYTVGNREARDVVSLSPADLAGVSVACLDADAAGGMGEAQAAALVRYVTGGGRLVVEGCDGYLDRLRDILPVERAAARKCTGAARALDATHPALVGIPFGAWRLDGLEVGSRAGANGRVLVDCGGVPLVTVGKAGQGKIVATPLSHLRERYSWMNTPGYDSLLTLLNLALAVAPDDLLLRESWASAARYWMYADFAVGYHKYRFDATGETVAAYDDAEAKLLAARAALDRGDLPQCRSLLQPALDAAQKAQAASGSIGGALATADADAASTRRDLLRLAGALDVVHGMNLSQGPLGAAGFWYPATGRALLDDRPRLDLAPGAGASFWRGLHPYLLADAALPTEPDADRLWQRRADGSRIDGPNRDVWIDPAVKAIQAQTFGTAYDGALINEAGGAEWNTYGSTPGADYSDFAQRAFRLYLADQGLAPQDVGAASWDAVAAPPVWSPTRLYYEWQVFRSLYLCERLKTSFWSMKLTAPGAVPALQPGSLGDPWRVGVGAEAAQYVDLLCPLIARGLGAGADPVDVELACRELWSLTDADGDGAADRPPGFAARFGWGAPLALPPEAHRSAAAVALLSGARGIMETWASDGRGGNATATMPEEVFLRWQAAFEPALRYEDAILDAKPARATVGVWDSWHSAAMAQGAGQPGTPDAWALSQPREWAALLIRAGLTPRFLYDRNLREGDFLGLSAIIVPSTLCLNDAERAKLSAFCEQGGTLILGCGAGAFDATHVPRAGGLGFPPGVTSGRITVGEQRAKAQVAAPWAKLIGATGLTLGQATQPLQVGEGVEVLASGAGGPVVGLRRFGKGAAMVWGASVWAGDGPSQGLVQKALESVGVARPAYAQEGNGGWAWQVRVLVMDRARGALVGVAHYQPYSEQKPLTNLTVRVRLPGDGYTVSRLSDARPYVRNDHRAERIPSSAADGCVTFRTDLNPCEVRFFLLEPA